MRTGINSHCRYLLMKRTHFEFEVGNFVLCGTENDERNCFVRGIFDDIGGTGASGTIAQ